MRRRKYSGIVPLLVAMLLLLTACDGGELHPTPTGEILDRSPAATGVTPTPMATEKVPSPTATAVPTHAPATFHIEEDSATLMNQDAPTLEVSSDDEAVQNDRVPEAEYLTVEVPPCTPIEGSSVDPCEPYAIVSRAGATRPPGGSPVLGDAPKSIRGYLDGSSILTPVHIVLRGTFIPDSIRCLSGIPYIHPSYMDPGSTFGSSLMIECYADMRVGAYILGSGPPKLTVRVEFEHYYPEWDAEIAKEHSEHPEAIAVGVSWTQEDVTEGIRFAHEDRISNGQRGNSGNRVTQGIPGREVMLFVGTGHTIEMESWAVHSMWDIQRRGEGDNETVVVVHPYAKLWKDRDPEGFQTHLAKLEMSLPSFTQAVSSAHSARVSDNGGRIVAANHRARNMDVDAPMIQTDANKLTQFYTSVGAYADPNSPPAKPPPPCAAALPDGDHPRLMPDCLALLAAKDILRGTGSLNWDIGTAITSWDGITVAGTPKRVTKVKLANKSLTGSIPEDLVGLDALTELKLSGNSLTGCIPLGLKSVATNDLSSLKLLYCQPPAPTGLAAGTVGETSVPLTWTAVANTSKYRVEYRLDGASSWTVSSDALTGTSHTVSGLSCGKKHQFRVSAYGSGTTYAAAWSDPSAAVEASAAACVTPAFGKASYSFTVSQPAYTGNSVGTVSATDPNGDRLTYSITAGNQSLAFAIGGSTGAITLAGVVTGGSSHTLTVEASDGTNKDTATVSVKVDPCPNNDLPGVDQDVSPGQPPGCGPDDGAVGPG